MKSQTLATCLLTSLWSTAVHADNLVKNGDFETGEGNAFYETTGWYNLGTGLNQGAPARSDKGEVIAGTYSASVNDRYVTEERKFGPTAHVQKTAHIIRDGDSFSVVYEWRPADEFWQRATDTIRFVLYATSDNKSGGPVVWSSELTSDVYGGNTTNNKQVLQTSEVVNGDAVGQNLFVMFYGVDTRNGGNDSSPHWARVDNIEVEAIGKGETQ
jgi:hypothetical protein